MFNQFRHYQYRNLPEEESTIDGALSRETYNLLPVNVQYYYDDTDILGILQVALKKLDVPSVFVASCAVGNSHTSLIEYLKREKTEHSTERKILIPYNIEHYYWVGVIIVIDSNNQISEISCIGSLIETARHNITDAIRQANSVYPELSTLELKFLEGKRNQEPASYGPLTVENLLAAAKNEYLQEENISAEAIISIRTKHIEQYRQYDDAFIKRQSENSDRIASLFLSSDWFNDSTELFNKHELAHMLCIVSLIMELGMTDIVSAFKQQTAESSSSVNSIHAFILRESSTLNESNRANFTQLLEELFDEIPIPLITLDLSNSKLRITEKAMQFIIKRIEDYDPVRFSAIQKILLDEIKINNQHIAMSRERFFTLPLLKALKDTAKFSTIISIPTVIGVGGNVATAIILANVNQDTLAASNLISVLQNLVVNTTATILKSVLSAVAKAEVNEVDIILKKGMIAGIILTGPALIILLNSGNILTLLKQEEALAAIAQSYFNAHVIGIPAFLLTVPALQVAVGTKNGVSTILLSAGYEVIACSIGPILALGLLNNKPLEAAGVGYASAIASWSALLGFSCYLQFSPAFKGYSLSPFSLKHVQGNWNILGQLFKIGLPIGTLVCLDALGSLTVSTLIGSYLNEQALAAHQITSQYVMFTLVPQLGISQACTVLVGTEVKNKNYFNAKRVTNVSLSLGAGFALLTLTAFATIPRTLMRPFIDPDDPANSEIVDTTQNLLLLAGIGQVLDATRLISAGSLQGGFDHTLLPMMVGLGIWGIAIPLGYTLGLTSGLGASGFYIARDVGLAIGNAVLLPYLYKRFTETLAENSNRNQPCITTHTSSGMFQPLFNCFRGKFRMNTEQNQQLLRENVTRYGSY